MWEPRFPGNRDSARQRRMSRPLFDKESDLKFKSAKIQSLSLLLPEYIIAP